jgi:single-stranded DNA-binding protein
VNSVSLSGQIAGDVELLERDGVSYARIEIHTLTAFRDTQGEMHQRFDEHRVLVFGSLVRRVQSLKEGDWITVRGAMRTCGFSIGGHELLDVEVLASEVSGRPARNRPDLSAHPAPTAEARCSWRTPRPRFARSRRRAPGRGGQPLHPVDDALLFDPFADGLLAMTRDAEP